MTRSVPPTATSRESAAARVLARTSLFGVLVAGLIAASGSALATSDARSGHASGGQTDGDRNGGTTGAWNGEHFTDPYGFHHSETDPRLQAEHQNAQREYFQRQNQATPSPSGTGGGAAAWTPTPRPDGDGWTVCRPLASWC